MSDALRERLIVTVCAGATLATLAGLVSWGEIRATVNDHDREISSAKAKAEQVATIAARLDSLDHRANSIEKSVEKSREQAEKARRQAEKNWVQLEAITRTLEQR